MVAYLISFFAALAATLALTPVARLLALRWGIVDNPDGKRKLQKQPVPLLGGIAVYGGWWLGLALMIALGLPVRLPAGTPVAALTLAALSLVGVFDDAFNLKARWKLLGQILATLPIALSPSALSIITWGDATIDLGAWGSAVTVAWLVLGINALNLLDGIDGMASTTGLGICLTTAALDIYCGSGYVGMFALGLAGALTGFLLFNFPPAKIYLGDAGSMVIGLAISLASMRVARNDAGITNLSPMIALMALPLADTGLAILRRSLSGRGIWHADRGHIHHRLLDQGMSVRQVLALVAGFSILWGTVVVVAGRESAGGMVWLVAACMAIVALRFRLAGHHELSLFVETLRRRLRPRSSLSLLAGLESLSFAEAWQRLQTPFDHIGPARLTLSIECADGSSREHDWSNEADQTAAGAAVVEFVRRSSAGNNCRLRMETSRGQADLDWPTMLTALEQFAEFWSEHPESAPSPLQLHISAESVETRRSSDPRFEQRRAA
jgi:UDP-GlcNAc:undecaprenyl-phosphate/decaprenyl-phosphate GlcNAc-1-phosphate transferase